MKDIYSPLEIDEEWDNYAPIADGGSTALMERPAEIAPTTNIPVSSSDVQTPPTTETGSEAFAMPASNVMPGIDSNNTGIKEPTEPDTAYQAAEALIDKPATNTDTFDIADTSSNNSSDTSGLVKITPGKTTTETPTTGTPQEIKGVPINVMGGGTAEETSEETPDSSSTLADTIDESTGESEIVSVPEATSLIAPMVKEEDSDDVINTGAITPDTGEKSTDTMVASDDEGESSGNNSENSESSSDDDTENTEADTSSSDSAGKPSETKADKAKTPTNPDDDDKLAGILDRWLNSNREIAKKQEESDKKIAEELEQEKEDAKANITRMKVEISKIQRELSQQIAELDEGIGNEEAKLANIQANLSKLAKDKDN